ncbi:MAG: phosphotransferase [Deltaproteobacteria bacterium]|nr:phosphotransferase [Deltaproteobacteria bacterium]
MIKCVHDSYHFGSSGELAGQHVDQLIQFFNVPTTVPDSAMGGRGSVVKEHLEGIGSVVIKSYRRGGFMRHLVKSTYLKWGKTRSQLEYEILLKMADLGVNVPEPVAYAYQGKFCYRSWLVSREIKQQQTLADLSFVDEGRTRTVMGKVLDQVSLLIKNNLHHVDLHPGNVLVDSNDRVYIIDFDKAYFFGGSRKRLWHKYVMRWQRAVSKHRLSGILIEEMSRWSQRNYLVDRFLCI